LTTEEREEAEQYWGDDMDGDAQSALASAGHGTDEDYGGYAEWCDSLEEYPF
jgi:hypothetical protein